MRDIFDDPVISRVGLGLPPAGIGILNVALPVPDQFADIEFIVQKAGPASPVAINGAGPPGLAVGPGDAVGVELMGNSPW